MSKDKDVVFLGAKSRDAAKRLIRGAMKGANLPDSMLVEYPGRNDPVLLEQLPPRTGILQEEFVQNEHGTGRAKVKLHIVDFENSNAEDGLRLKLGEEAVEAYCATLGETETIASGTTVPLLYINDRWTIVLGGSGQTYFEGKIESENDGVYNVKIFMDAGTGTYPDHVEATTRFLNNGETLEIGRVVGITWTPMYGYRITSAACPQE